MMAPNIFKLPEREELLIRLKHMILSHHGTLEYGSPKVPMTPEAMLLHAIDMMDTRMHMVLRDLKEDKNNQTAWTPFKSKVVSDEFAALTTVVVGRSAPAKRVAALAKTVTVVRAPLRGGRIDLRWLMRKIGGEKFASWCFPTRCWGLRQNPNFACGERNLRAVGCGEAS